MSLETQIIDYLLNQSVLVAFFVYTIYKTEKLFRDNIKLLERVSIILDRNEKVLQKLEKKLIK